ncbi:MULTISPECIES: hypothetical protein [Rhizobium/Agrobacterium group]|uniref:Holin n=1 Tax=Agrobacterium vitis TaxID=373 RepID=A0ABD6H604_AGRVI|nr:MULTISPECIES: hypothetical protein [Rhizobium/Agrobacterium group]MUO27416.1 hypothetical protein [Agrobacterium vitis]MUO42134.1 hypothetical protein [Agrobacterium vitis]MUP09442.1 hypothetical protein [Agrobacterium vitis]
MRKLRPVENWRMVLARAWSVRFTAAAGLIFVIQPVVDALVDGAYGLEAWVNLTLRALQGLLTFAAIWARVVAQKGLSDADQ